MKTEETKKSKPMCRIQNESREDYLEAIYLLTEKSDGEVRSAKLARYMGFSKASISRAIGILKEEGYLHVDSETLLLSLTNKGLAEAKRVYSKHCFFESQLLAAGVDRETAKKEACRMEHAVSDGSFQKLLEAYGGARSQRVAL